jgi:D-glycero-alpha-D-manno-heptose-7-phosphate kinase
VDVHTRSESPVGAGIAGSSAMNIALIGALTAWTGRTMGDDEMLTLAMNIEAQVIGVPTGLQDYRPALHGGIAAIDMDATGVRRTPIGIDPAELGRRIVLAYTGAPRQSGINNWDVMTRRIEGDQEVIRAFDGIRDAATRLRAGLDAGDWTAAAEALDCEWAHRKRLCARVTTPQIDALLEGARTAGALAGKICGAGGGGCLVCLVPPDRRQHVADALTEGGATVLPCSIETTGLRLERS